MLEVSSMAIGVFLDQEMKTTGSEPTMTTQRRNGMTSHTQSSGHLVFQCSFTLEKRSAQIVHVEEKLCTSMPIQAVLSCLGDEQIDLAGATRERDATHRLREF